MEDNKRIYASTPDHPGQKMSLLGCSVTSEEAAQRAAMMINEATCGQYNDSTMKIVLSDDEGNSRTWTVEVYRVTYYDATLSRKE